MTTMDDRERAFEAKFSMDLELAFRARARKTQLLALWAATRMGMAGDHAQDYAKQLVFFDIDQRGHGDILAKVAADMDAKGEAVDAHDIEAELKRLEPRVRREIYGDPSA